MSDTVRDLLVRGIAAAKANSKQEAKFYLEWVTRLEEASRDELIDAYRYLAQISDDPKERRNNLEQALAYNPSDPEARRALAILNGELQPEEIINPDRFAQPAAPDSPAPAQARRFVCTQCGGKMQFTPDGTTLACEYCGHKQSLLDMNEPLAMVEENNFIVAMATAKGHSKPVLTRSIKCPSCGASFVLTPQTISKNCPYCDSAYVIEHVEERELIEPDGILPFAITQDQALKTEIAWFRKEGMNLRGTPKLPAGVYLPVWTFDVAGELTWTCMVYRNKEWIPQSGNRALFANDVLVPASHHLSKTLVNEITQTPLDQLVPYDPRFLVDWLAETYDVAVGDASIVARSQVFHREKDEITKGLFEQYSELNVSSANVVVDSYKLILLPMWVTYYRIEDKQYGMVINGHTGNLRADKPRNGVVGWLANLLDL